VWGGGGGRGVVTTIILLVGLWAQLVTFDVTS